MKKRGSGIFISFEGTEGAGKSTLIRKFASRLRRDKYPVLITREPGGGPLSEKIRNIILKNPMDPWTEVLLYEASRSEHVTSMIRPALLDHKIVLCDRFADSSLAYQAHARGLPWAKVEYLNELATHGLTPDLTVLLDVDPRKGLERAKSANRFEEEGVAFQAKVRRGFIVAMGQDPDRFLHLRVDRMDPESILERVEQEVEARFSRKLKAISEEINLKKRKSGNGASKGI